MLQTSRRPRASARVAAHHETSRCNGCPLWRSSRMTGANVQVRQDLTNILQTTARQTDVMRIFLGAADDAWLVVCWQAHRLRLVELGILECRDTQQPVSQSRSQSVLRRCRSRFRGRARAIEGGRQQSAAPFRRRDGGAVHGAGSSSSTGGRRTPRTRPRRSASRTTSSRCRSWNSPLSLKETPIDLDVERRGHPRRRCCRRHAGASAAATRSDCQIPRAAACLDSERTGRTNRNRCPADVPSSRSGCRSRAFSRVPRARPLRRTTRRGRPAPNATARAPPADPFGGTSR